MKTIEETFESEKEILEGFFKILKIDELMKLTKHHIHGNHMMFYSRKKNVKVLDIMAKLKIHKN